MNRLFARSCHVVQITHTVPEQVAQWGFQNNATHTSPPGPAFVLEVPLRNLLTSICDFVPCDWIAQRAHCRTLWFQFTSNAWFALPHKHKHEHKHNVNENTHNTSVQWMVALFSVLYLSVQYSKTIWRTHFAYDEAYRSVFSLDISIGKSTIRTKTFVLLEFCASALPGAGAYVCAVGVLTTVIYACVDIVVKPRFKEGLRN